MTHEQWQRLCAVIDGQSSSPPAVGFISDSPWLPNWAGMSILDYYTSEARWLEANLLQVRTFPEIMFLPGFWAEYGMCTEPSAFGARCTWAENEFPFAHKLPLSLDELAVMPKPDPRQDGLAPFVLKRLQHCQPAIEQAGHSIRFAVARGPWNLASFLMGTTEFMTELYEHPDKVHAMLKTVTQYLVDWLQLQASTFATIDGVLMLDDIIGFVGHDDLVEFGVPYLKQVFGAVDARVRFFHNDAAGLVCAPLLPEIGVNMFNFSHKHSIADMRRLTADKVTLVGNIPPRDVLASGMPDAVEAAVRAAMPQVGDARHVVLSCGGGMPPGVSTDNIRAFLRAAGY